MQISCPNCIKKFEVKDELIPAEGRLLQCGSCNYKWHYKKIKIIEEIEEKTPEKEENNLEISIPVKKEFKIKSKDKKILIDQNFLEKKEIIKRNYFKLFLVLIITFISIIILIDTFQMKLFKIFPYLEFILYSFYETLIDINLFFKDLVK